MLTYFIAIIPARYASTRFPGKPLADIDGKPMIRRVYERVQSVYEHCCVATDDERIMHAVEEFGGKAVMTSTSHRSGTDRCAEALGIYEKMSGLKFDVVVNVQGDEPFISEEQLLAIREPFDSPATTIATLVKAFSPEEDIFNPNTPKVVVSESGNALYFSRAAIPHIRGAADVEWQRTHKYWKHIGLYAYRVATLREITLLPQSPLEKAESLEQLRWLENGYTIAVRETTTESIAIDTPDDLHKAVKKMQNAECKMQN